MPKVKQATLLTPIQEELMQLLGEGLKTGEGSLGEIFGFNEQNFQEGVEKPALKHFQESILPNILEKFAGQGNMGSGIRRATLKAGSDLQSQLAALRYQAQQQGQQNKLTGLNQLLGTHGFENIVKQPAEKSSIWNKVLPAAGTALGAIGGGLFGGPAGAVAGASAGGAAGNAIAG